MWLTFIIQSVLTWEFKEYYNCGSWLGDTPFNTWLLNIKWSKPIIVLAWEAGHTGYRDAE